MTTLWLLAILAPVVIIASVGLVGLLPTGTAPSTYAWLGRLAPVSVLPTVLLVIAGPRAGELDLSWLLLGSTFGVDTLGRPLLLVAALLYLAALIAATAAEHNAVRLSAFLLLCFVGNAGVFVAADVVTFYVSFAIMSFAAYGLIIHNGSEFARRAGRIYLFFTVLGEVCILAATMLITAEGGFVLADAPAVVADSVWRDAIVLLLLLGFGIKAGAVPLHAWLPLAYPAAPAMASAVLSGTMAKTGLYGWLSFLPLGELTLAGWGSLMVLVGLLGTFLAIVPGVVQTDPKATLAYSSISQMGFLMVLVGVALATPEYAEACLLAATLYAVHHGLAKGALFFGVPLWHTHGGGTARWFLLLGLGGATLAIAGAPLSSGFIAKYAAKEAVGDATFAGVDVYTFLVLVGTASTVLLARYGWLLITAEPASSAVGAQFGGWAVLVGSGTILTWLLAGDWVPVESVPSLDASTVWDETWPILVGALLVAVAYWLSSREVLPPGMNGPRGKTVPPGDIIVAEEELARRSARTTARVTSATTRTWHRAGARAHSALIATTTLADVLGRLEGRLDRWAVSGVTTLLLIVLVLSIGVL